MKLQHFKTMQLTRLIALKKQFADNTRIQEIINNHLIPKLHHLRARDLADYIFTLYLASREFKVFEELISSEQEVDELIEEKNKLYAFKARYMSRLMSLRKELNKRYSEKTDRVETIIFEIAPKLANLRRHMLTDYLFTVTLACKEFQELCSLIPSEQEIKQLYKE